MDLASGTTARYSASLILGLTNPDDRNASTINWDRLNLAADDVLGDFLVHCGIAFDETNDAHMSIGCTGVVLHLRQRLGQAKLDDDERRYFQALKDLAQGQGGRQRVLADTTTETDVDNRLRRRLRDYVHQDVITDADYRDSED